MPGRNLNNEENRLLRLWNNPPAGAPFRQLRSIELWSPGGVRGIQSLRIPFRYPITAICGANGAGKTTALALASLAFHSPDDWRVRLGNANPKRNSGNSSYYRFSDFFLQGEGDGGIGQTTVTWRYFDGVEESAVEFSKTDRWGVYSRRPERPAIYLSLTRVLPAYEISNLVRNFTSIADIDAEVALTAEFVGYLSLVMGRRYDSADIMDKRGLNFQKCNSSGAYTAFNMGGGEASVISLLYTLQVMPIGGLLVVDEIEAGLHLNAQRRLVEVLTLICRKKQIQVICCTHSEHFIDSLPRISRIVLKKNNNIHTVVENPSTRYAMYEMDGRCKPELTIYCEDLAAKALIESSVDHDVLVRLKIVPIGSDSKVATQGVSHIRSGFEMRCLCVFDGDVEDNQIRQWIRSERGERGDIEPKYIVLPGDGLPPERWVVEQLVFPAYTQQFSEKFNCNVDTASAHIEAMRVELDHHSIGFILAQRINLDEGACLSRIMQSVGPVHPQLDVLREKITELVS